MVGMKSKWCFHITVHVRGWPFLPLRIILVDVPLPNSDGFYEFSFHDGAMKTLLGPELQYCINFIKANDYDSMAEVLALEKDDMAEQVFNNKLLLKLPMVETDEYFCPN
jgi:hypothetical protein